MSPRLYRLLTDAAGPALRLHLRYRIGRGREDPQRIGERLGETSRGRPPGRLVWLHAASVGESMSVLGLIRRLRDERRDLALLVTTGTVTSARLLAERLPAGALHQYAPLDHMAWVKRFLDHWRPDLALWVESELWPNLLSETQSRGIPVALLNGRMSDRSFARWRRAPGFIAPLLGRFALVLAQDERHAKRFAALGAKKARCVGNLKFAVLPLPAAADGLATLRAAIGERPVWLAASTHPGEETIVASVHRLLRPTHPGLLTIIAPRHAERGKEIAASLASRGHAVALRSLAQPIADATHIYLADTMGELGLFYRLAGIAFLGGSLVRHGGHNPIEAAQLDCAILSGPHVDGFAEIYDRLERAGGARIVADAAGLAQAVAALLADPVRRTREAEAAAELVFSEARALDAVMAELRPLIRRLPRGDHARA